jgi:hypothetical protein
MDVRMPDGTIITGVPDNITQADLLARYSRFSAAAPTSTARKPATGPAMAVDPMGNFTGMEEQPVAQPQGLAAIAPKQSSEFAPIEELKKGLGSWCFQCGAEINVGKRWRHERRWCAWDGSETS